MKLSDEVPNDDDWGNININLDINTAYEIYANRSNTEMMSRFTMSPVESAGEIQFMPIKPFQYYIRGFSDAVISLQSCAENNSDAASSFLGLIEEIAMTNIEMLRPVYDDLESKISYVAENQSNFDADSEIYGNFIDTYKNIKLLMS